MRFKFLGPLCLVAALLPTVAHAHPISNYYFELSQGSEVFNFHIDASETGTAETLSSFNFTAFDATGDDTTSDFSLGIDTDSGSEGIAFLPMAFLAFDTPGNISTFYTGDGTTAQFGLGTYDLTGSVGVLLGDYQLQVSDTPFASPVPEPSSLALLGTGVLGIAGTFRRRIFS